MRKFKREESPEFLVGRWAEWGERYRNNKLTNPGFTFQWPTYQGSRINTSLEPILSKQTQHHCSYCDGYPVKEKEDSIDHFKPKGTEAYYTLVCQWENLYYSCHNCQSWKLEQYSALLIKPDADDYSFNDYFIYNFKEDKLDPNPMADQNKQQAAEDTIRILGLNETGHKIARRIMRERYDGKMKLGEPVVIDDFDYRFVIE